MNQKKVTILAFSPIARDARVLRQIKYLSEKYSVSVIGYGQLNDYPHVKMISLSESNPAKEELIVIGHAVNLKNKIRTWIGWDFFLLLFDFLNNLYRYIYRLINIIREKVQCKKKTIMCMLLPRYVYWRRPKYKEALAALLSTEADIIHANDWDTLPIALRVSSITKARVILDLHEYAPLEFENNRQWYATERHLVNYFLKVDAPKVDATVTVNQNIADKYELEYGFAPLVVMSAPEYDSRIVFRPTNNNPIHLIHHGIVSRSRKLDLMVEIIAQADSRYFLNFMLVTNGKGDEILVQHLKALADTLAPGRVIFHAPVPYSQILRKISLFDIGIYPLPPACYNQKYALPNKYFDFIHAGLAICIGPSPEMARLIEQYHFGVVAPSFEPSHIAAILDHLSGDEINQMKRKSLEARSILCADIEMKKLINLYEKSISPSA